MSGRRVPGAAELVAAARTGDRRALGRLLTLAERGGRGADEVDAAVSPAVRGATVVGITGAPGAGKSSLTGRLAARLAEAGERVGVIAVDPSSPFSGGAVLGDRVRMDEVTGERRDAVFIRSMATRGHEGGLALAVPLAVRVFDAVGFDRILVETVGVGQVEVEVAGAADTTVVVVTPGWGDAVQAAKAGLLEVGDVFVVNKADRPGVGDAVRDLERMLDLSPGAHDPQAWRPPVVTTVATTGEGIERLVEVLDEHRRHLVESGEGDRRRSGRRRREIRERALAAIARRLDAELARDGAEGSAGAGAVSVGAAAAVLVDRLTGGASPTSDEGSAGSGAGTADSRHG